MNDIATALKENVQLTELSLSLIKKMNEHFCLLYCANYLKKKIDSCYISQEGAKLILASLMDNTHLKNLHFGKFFLFRHSHKWFLFLTKKQKDKNYLGDQCLEILPDVFKSNSTITELSFGLFFLRFFFWILKWLLIFYICRIRRHS